MPVNYTDKSIWNVLTPGNGLNNVNVTNVGAINSIMAANGAVINYRSQSDLGKRICFTNAEIATYTYTPNGTLYGGVYQLVQVDSGATAASIGTGLLAYLQFAKRSTYTVTDVSHADATSEVAGVFLNTITPGNYGFIFVGNGYVTGSFKASIANGSPAAGDNVVAGAASGFMDDAAAQTVAPTGLFVGRAVTAPASSTKSVIYIDHQLGII